MKVYIVIDSGAYHCAAPESILGVYTSEEAAMKAWPNASSYYTDEGLLDGDEDLTMRVWIQEEEVTS